MKLSARSGVGLGIVVALSAGLTLGTLGSVQGESKAENEAAVQRARQQIKMLDDIYKTAVIGITSTYVKKETDTPAITLGKALFDTMKKKGWHETKLLDATGHPYSEVNVAKDEFEKAAVDALKGGKDYYEQLVKVNGEQRLRAATPVPVVLEKCTMCHENYKSVKPGAPIGILTYDVPVK